MYLRIYSILISNKMFSEKETKFLVKNILAILKAFSKKNGIRIYFSEECLDLLNQLFENFSEWKKLNYLKVTNDEEAHFIIYTFIISKLNSKYYDQLCQRAANYGG